MTDSMRRNTTIAGAILLASALAGRGPAQAGEGGEPGPRAADLPALQERIRAAARRAVPSVVALPAGTGVIVSADGLVLSQAHITHEDGLKAGSRVTVHLGDGSALEAEVLGADRLYDLSALRLPGPGPYPFAPLSDAAPRPGDGVLKLGYPMPLGHRRGRPPEVRFGRVLARAADAFLTDCMASGGDSGGPYFDLDGRVVGILSSTGSVLGRDHEGSVHMERSGLWFYATPAAIIRARLDAMAGGTVSEATHAEKVKLHEAHKTRKSEMIPEGRWMQGKESLGAFRDAVAAARRGVVEVLDGEEVAVLGTVVDPAGLVLTQASEVPEPARCRLPGGRVAAARVVGVDPAYDLALLRVDADGLEAVPWSGAVDPAVGTLVAAAGPGELPLAAGVVSVPRRDGPGPHAATIPRRRRGGAGQFRGLSAHRADPPTFLAVDAPVTGPECGGPVVGLDGKAIGLVVARYGLSGCYVIPADRVAARLADLRAGRPMPGLPPRPDPQPPARSAPAGRKAGAKDGARAER